jgi:ComF family protein
MKMNIATSMVRSFLDFIYPPVCISCGKFLHNDRQNICRPCLSSIPLLTREHTLYQETRAKLLAENTVSDLIACYVFEKEGPFQHIAHALKYQEYKSFGVELGKRIGTVIYDSKINVDVIIPVPLHRIKQRERGYNQSDYIAYGVSSIIGKPVISDAIYRTRYTKTQTQLDFQERQKNMRDAFALKSHASEKLQGKICLLVDDVITTGATTNSCAKEILSAGATSIIAASAALAK